MGDKKELMNDGDYKIELDTFDSRFHTFEKQEENWNELKIFNTYKEAQEYLDNRDKRKKSGKMKKAEPLMCYKMNYHDKPKKSKITSIDVSGTYSSSFYVWVVEEESKSRSKEGLYELYKRTEKNKEIFDKVRELNKQIEELKNSRERFTEKEIKKHFQDEEESKEATQ